MNPYWLLIPYLCFIPVDGVRYFLLGYNLPNLLAKNFAIQSKLYRIRALNIVWYRWLLRFVKDWFFLGILGVPTVGALIELDPRTVPVALAVLAGILILRSLAPGLLLLYSLGCPLPNFILGFAARLAIPDYVPCNRKRVLLWCAAFMLAGAASLWAWFLGAGMYFVLWGLILLTLGFLSLIKGATLNKEVMEAENIAKEAG